MVLQLHHRSRMLRYAYEQVNTTTVYLPSDTLDPLTKRTITACTLAGCNFSSKVHIEVNHIWHVPKYLGRFSAQKDIPKPPTTAPTQSSQQPPPNTLTHNGPTNPTRPLRQEARSFLQYSRRTRTVRPQVPFPQFRKSANTFESHTVCRCHVVITAEKKTVPSQLQDATY
jgi:hypothetical protein